MHNFIPPVQRNDYLGTKPFGVVTNNDFIYSYRMIDDIVLDAGGNAPCNHDNIFILGGEKMNRFMRVAVGNIEECGAVSFDNQYFPTKYGVRIMDARLMNATSNNEITVLKKNAFDTLKNAKINYIGYAYSAGDKEMMPCIDLLKDLNSFAY